MNLFLTLVFGVGACVALANQKTELALPCAFICFILTLVELSHDEQA